ncbi:MAG: type II secretion system protein GspN, partial [Syntrophaceae bacterium]|nr:type II secretion system protein GspN [Syntrophaceae bacterium]
EAAFEEIRIEEIAWLKEPLSSPLTGRLQGTFQYSGEDKTLRSGTGQLDFTMVNGNYLLREPLFGFDRVDFSRIEGKIGYRNGALQLSQLTLTGERLRLAFRGNLLLAEQWPESRLELTGTIQLTDQGDRQLRVAIDGTVGNPRARLL